MGKLADFVRDIPYSIRVVLRLCTVQACRHPNHCYQYGSDHWLLPSYSSQLASELAADNNRSAHGTGIFRLRIQTENTNQDILRWTHWRNLLVQRTIEHSWWSTQRDGSCQEDQCRPRL